MNNLADIGFFEGILPFVVTYALFFFILRYIAEDVLKLGGSGSDSNNRPDQFAAILSVAFAFFSARFVMMNPVYTDFFTQYLGRVTVVIIGLLGLLVTIGFVGIDLESNNAVGWTLALIIVAAFAVSGGVSASILPTDSQSQILGLVAEFLNFTVESGLIFVVLIGGLLLYTMRGGGDGSDDGGLPGFFVGFGDEDQQDQDNSA